MNNDVFTDKRILEALDMIDDKFIAEVTTKYEILRGDGGCVRNKRRIYKAYAVALMRAACVLLLIGIVAALPTVISTIRNPSTPPAYSEYILTQEDLNYINLVFLEHNSPKFAETLEEANKKESFYGKYSDCFIFEESGQMDMIYRIVIGNYLFTSPDRPAFSVVYDGDIYNLFEAYEFGYLTDTDVKMLNEYLYGHIENDIRRYYDDEEYIMSQCGPIELTYDEIKDIVHSYFRWTLTVYSDFTLRPEEVYYVRCFGKFDGAYAVMVDQVTTNQVGSGYPYTDQTVYGYVFENENMGYMFVYEDSQLYTLNDAADNGILSKEEVGSLHKYYNETKNQYYNDYFYAP